MQYAKVERTIAGRSLSFETGRIAKQAAGSVLARYGDSMVLTAVCSADPRPGLDFFPLTVDYREKTYAAGKFPGGFIKREGRPKDKEILTMRLIDRPVRPLWPDGYKDEVQIMNTVVSVDKENDPDLVAMNSSFAALRASTLPFRGPIAAVRIGRIDGEFIGFPTIQQLDEGDLELVMVASKDALVMVEGKSVEINEPDFLEALDFGNEIIQQILEMMEELREKAEVAECTWKAPEVEVHPIHAAIQDGWAAKMSEALLVQGKHERYTAMDSLKEAMRAEYIPADADDVEAAALKKVVSAAHRALSSQQIRQLIVKQKKRIDLRKPDDIRQITIEPGILPRTHGSALFTRGETQSLVVTTLGTPRDQQIVDGLMEEYSKRFDLQYNFPPYCVGECRPIRGVSRREIGHGYLAERAVAPVIPSDDEFPYTIRIVSDITESNGSSSMASVCGATISMMDAGVPIRQPVAGIAMGLVEEDGDVVVLSDILGTEDHVGDMDFKVAGTGRGITAVQMDIKMQGLSREILAEALEQARKGRLHILREMIKAIGKPREDISEFAPRLLQVRIPVEKIGLVIGPGGKMIKKIQEETGAKVEIDDDGIAVVSSESSEAALAAKGMIEQLTAEVEVGRIYDGRVVSIKDFGCFVEVLPGQEGLCHVSELDSEHVREVSDVVSLGDMIPVKVILRDEQGRLKLSRRVAMEELSGGGPRGSVSGDADDGAGESQDERPSRPPRGRDRDDRPSRGRDRDDRPSRGRDRDDRPSRGRDRDDRPSPGGDDDREYERPQRSDRDEGRDRDDRGRGRDRDGDRDGRGRSSSSRSDDRRRPRGRSNSAR